MQLKREEGCVARGESSAGPAERVKKRDVA
jgi:hypothetical protein